MTDLQTLSAARICKKHIPRHPSKPPKAPFEVFEGDHGRGFSEIDSVSLAERSAIVEYGDSVPRAWAEGFARLNLANPLPGFSGSRWWVLINDGRKFLHRWAVEANCLGWQAADVFGIHPTVPAYRNDQMGLVLLIDDGEVKRTPIGSHLSYARRASPFAFGKSYRGSAHEAEREALWRASPR